ncbi:MAG: radical SAM protein, partial [Desulfatitalea sp.]|nr:radical SAM protein [Desulfatitalea sp.]NNK02711.1 radical SAM protein [Desulfatitalea sp.]
MTNARPKQTPFIVPVFIPHAGCPHRCIFCDQGATTGDAAAFPTAREVRRGITQFLSYRRDTTRPTEISFYGGNFLGLPPEQVQLLLATVAGYVQAGQADGIRFSTRPDTIDDRRLDWIRPFPVKTIEIGVQSMNDEALRLSGRGHTALDTERAFDVLAESAFRVGAQIMVGLPGDTHPAAMASAR